MKTNIIKLFGFGLATGLTLTACSDEFLQDKQNYNNVGPEIFDDYDGARLRVNDIYYLVQPDVNESRGWKSPSSGRSDDQSQSTEEYSGFGAFVNPQNELNIISGTSVPDYFYSQITTSRRQSSATSGQSTTP